VEKAAEREVENRRIAVLDGASTALNKPLCMAAKLIVFSHLHYEAENVQGNRTVSCNVFHRKAFRQDGEQSVNSL
jgi:hypothetical protein